MKKTILMEKYPVYTLEISKDETSYKTVREIIDYFYLKIEAHPVAKYIAIFDHYTHTSDMGGEIVDTIRDAQNIIFCFGKSIPNTKIVAVRPRSIGICELENSFVVEFLEAPKEELNKVMEAWARAIGNTKK